MTESILSYEVENRSEAEIIADVFTDWDITRPPQWLACLNPHSYAAARADHIFSGALHAAKWLIPDGVGVVIASRLLGGSIEKRVTGFDIFAKVMAQLDTIGGRVFFLGSSEKTLGMIRDKVAQDYPNIQIAGTYSPPFKPEFSSQDSDSMIAAVNAAQADILWVGMTAPKQELWIHENLPRLEVRFAGAIGAVFDFYTGQVKRSHPVFQRLGLEWLPRLVAQPSRLWRRMFISAPIFVADVLRQKFLGRTRSK